MMNRIELLRRLVAAAGVSGAEQRIGALLADMAREFVDEVRVDPVGNVIAHKKGSGKKILFSAHMDVVGFYVRDIDEKGNVYVGFTGGLSKESIWDQLVRFENGTVGVVRPVNADFYSLKPNDVKESHVYVEIGADSAEEAEKLVQIGESCVWVNDTIDCGNGKIMSPYTDDLCGCILLLEMMEALRNCPNELYFIFSTSEEIGCLGATAAAYGIDYDMALAVDVAPASDAPDQNTQHKTMKLDGGVAISMREHGFTPNREMLKQLTALAEREGIPYQYKISSGGTDARPLSRNQGGHKALSIGIPHRYIHTPIELVSGKDMDAIRELLVKFANEAQ